MNTYQKKSVRTLLLFLLSCSFLPAAAQRIAIETNTVQWATMAPNIGFQLFLSERISMDFSVGGCPFKLGKFQPKYILVTPQVRYWFGRPLTGHYVGVLAPFTDYNMRFNENMYKGEAVGFGASYGYYWVLNRRWSMGVTAGVGVARYRQFKYKHGEERPQEPNQVGWTAAPLNLAFNFSYILK